MADVFHYFGQALTGEWWYCQHHIRRKVMSDKHRCDPSIPRWQKRVDGALVERRDIRGVRFVRLMSNRETLLVYQGIARRPWQIVLALVGNTIGTLREGVQQ